MPFPNSQLLTTWTDVDNVMVNLPIAADATPTEAALTTGLNTLNGFSTTAPFSFSTTHPINPDSLENGLLMYEIDTMATN